MVDENIRAHYELGLEETRLLIDGHPALSTSGRSSSLGGSCRPRLQRARRRRGHGRLRLAVAERGYHVTLGDKVTDRSNGHTNWPARPGSQTVLRHTWATLVTSDHSAKTTTRC